jgi:hypothetical protein
MLRSSRVRAARSAGLPPCPNIRSNTTRGLMSIGSGADGELQVTVLRYTQLKPGEHAPT